MVLLSAPKYLPSGAASSVLRCNSPNACAPPMPPVLPRGMAYPPTLFFGLRDHLRLRGGPWISCVVRVEERVVGDFDRLRERHRGYGDDDSECGDPLGDALRPVCAACRAALALVDCLHCFLRCRSYTDWHGRIA